MVNAIDHLVQLIKGVLQATLCREPDNDDEIDQLLGQY